MKLLFTFISLWFVALLVGQEDFNLELVAHVPNDEPLSDIWGWVDEDGTEYAIVGARTHTEVYSLADPASPELIFEVPGASSVWRDMKSLGDYIYVTTDDGTDGVVIIDMTDAPNGISSTRVNPIVNGEPVQKCHNLYIDTEIEVMFLAGCNGSRGVLAFDITTDPLNPTLINVVSGPYAHDVFVRDNILYASEIFDGEFSIFNIEDIMNPVELGSAKTTNFFTHNAWSNETNEYVYTTDEVPNGTVDGYDITDINNPVKIDVFVPEAIQGRGVIPHNTHWLNDFLITSWYAYGIVISDVSNPKKIIEVGHYDTGSSPNCWGAYPYLPSGLILASDISNGLFVLRPTYERAAYAEGLVTDMENGNPIFDALVRIESMDVLTDRTDPLGQYVTGGLQEGSFRMIVSHPSYRPDTTEISLVKGETTEINIALTPETVYRRTVQILDKDSGVPIPSVEVQFVKDIFKQVLKTDENGEVSGDFAGGQFNIVAGVWGYKYGILDFEFIENGTTTIELERGYQDDFIFDYGWTNEAPNERSRWVRDVPIGTTFGDQESNPSTDVDDDIGDLCYFTGNGTGGVGAFDVDDGTTILTSPNMNLAMYPEAKLTFRPWFFNEGGSGMEPNDSYRIFANNGTSTELLVEINENTGGWAETVSVKLADFITLNDSVQIIFETSDDESGHLVEAGLDQFLVELESTVSTYEEDFSTIWTVFPNPLVSVINVHNDEFSGKANVAVLNSAGQVVRNHILENGTGAIAAPEVSGIYTLRITSEEGKIATKRITVISSADF